jgi:hypothetical protein
VPDPWSPTWVYGNCTFCGRYRPLTRQHGWPDWMNREFGHVISLPATNVIGRGDGTDTRTWKTPHEAFTYREPIVCRYCNSGWMSKLEGYARPMIVAMAQPTTLVKLGGPAQLTMSVWSWQTALVMGRMIDPTVIPASHYWFLFRHRLRKDFALPDHLNIWLGTHVGGPEVATVHLGGAPYHPLVRTSEDKPHVLMLKVLHLAIRIFYSPLGHDDPVAGNRGRFRDFFLRIWPAQLPSVIWPPAQPLEIEDFEAVLRAFG